MLKGQALIGGRGKAGAIRMASSEKQAESLAAEILDMTVKGYPVQHLLVVEKLNIVAEYYAAITIDRGSKSIVLMLSAAGGMDIEDIAARSPEKIRRLTLSGNSQECNQADLNEWLAESFSNPDLLAQALPIVQGMYRLFREQDCSLVEINPLVITDSDQLIAADAKIIFDDNSIFRHPETAELQNPEEYTADERQAQQAGLSFVSLSGNIGCIVNGAGLAMATLDGINLAGGSPANFLDVGGSSNPDKALNALRIILQNKQVKVILINIFGGITRCDDVAQGILLAKDQLDITVPMVIRLVGTNQEKGRDMLRKAGIVAASRMTDAIRDAVKLAKEGSPA